MGTRCAFFVVVAFILVLMPPAQKEQLKAKFSWESKQAAGFPHLPGSDTWSSGMRGSFSAGFFGNYCFWVPDFDPDRGQLRCQGFDRERTCQKRTAEKGKIKVDYIEIPVLFRLAYSRQSSVVPIIFVGPALGVPR